MVKMIVFAGLSFMTTTHDVFNQPTPFEHINTFQADPQLQHWLKQFSAGWDQAKATQLAKQLGDTLSQPEWIEKGFLANQFTPELHSHDRYGHRLDLVKYHPAYHDLMSLAIKHNIHALPWQQPQAGVHVARMALNYLYNQNEAGSACPLTMTFACVPSLQQSKALSDHWLPGVLSSEYDPSNRPMQQKKGLTIGMAMTEKQGGTDVRANTSTAQFDGAGLWGDRYLLTGHKWFCSAPMSDAFLTLAQTEAGLSCFLMPRWRADGSKNTVHIQRLKNKLGNRSNASSEIEFVQAEGWLIGKPGRGVPTIIQMVALTRYDCMIGSTALMRQAITQAIHHVRQRQVMGQLLVDQPLMQNVLADLCLEWAGALALTARMAHALDHLEDPKEQMYVRLMTAVGKFWICKQAQSVIGEAAECMGGAGYIEDHVPSRLYREAPVNSIWEGSGNVQCLDVLRALNKTPECWDVIKENLHQANGNNPAYDQHLEQFLSQANPSQLHDYDARSWVSQLAVLMQAATLLQHGEPFWADAFCQGRLGRLVYGPFGQLPEGIDVASLLQETLPVD